MTKFILAALASVISLSATAQDAQASHALYRRVVLGDIHAWAPATPPVTTSRVQPGSYARYLMLNGHAAQAALDQARQIGEVASTVEGPMAEMPTLTPYELYRRVAEGDWRLNVRAAVGPTAQLAR